MLRLFIYCLAALALAIGLSLLVMRDQGYVLVAYNGWSIEANLWAALAALFLILVAGYFLLRLLLQIRYSGRSLQHWLHDREARRSEAQLTAGLIAYMEGNLQGAIKTFVKGVRNSPAPLLNYLMAARASEVLGEDRECERYLLQAKESTPDADVAIGLTQAEIHLQNAQPQQGLVTLQHVQKITPEHPLMLRMLAQVNQELGDFEALHQLLPQLRKQKVLENEELAQLEFNVQKNLLAARSTGHTTPETLAARWENVPRELRQDSRLVEIYARALLAAGAQEQAEAVLRKQLGKHWDSNLVRLYGTVQARDRQQQLIVAEGWLSEHPDDSSLLLTLGRVSLMNELWGKAREYFAASIRFMPNAPAYAELGRLLAHLGDAKLSNDNFQQGLLLSIDGLPALPQPAKEIHAERRLATQPAGAL